MKKIGFALLVLFAFVFQGCRKNVDLLELIESGEDQSLLENEFSAVFDNVDNGSRGENDPGGRAEAFEYLPKCVKVTYLSETKTMTIDFGDSYCLCNDGRSRKGKIVVNFLGKYRTVGATTTVTLQDYFVKGLQGQEIKFEGTKTLTFVSQTQTGSRYSYTVSNAKAITAAGTISWQTTATIDRIQGDGTLTPWDDIYTVSASSSGINRRGTSFTVTTSQILKKKIVLNCASTFVSGILVLNNADGNKLTLNYDPNGNEACDKIASIQFNNGKVRNIVLR